MSNIVSVIIGIWILLFIFCVFIFLPVYLPYRLAKWIKVKTQKNIGYILPVGVVSYIVFFVYTIFFPLDSYYTQQFEEGIGFKIPESGIIEKKLQGQFGVRRL